MFNELRKCRMEHVSRWIELLCRWMLWNEFFWGFCYSGNFRLFLLDFFRIFWNCKNNANSDHKLLIIHSKKIFSSTPKTLKKINPKWIKSIPKEPQLHTNSDTQYDDAINCMFVQHFICQCTDTELCSFSICTIIVI